MPDIQLDPGVVFPVSDTAVTPITIPSGQIQDGIITAIPIDSDTFSLILRFDIMESKMSKKTFNFDETTFRAARAFFPFSDVTKNVLRLDTFEIKLEHLDTGPHAGMAMFTVTGLVPGGKVGGAGL